MKRPRVVWSFALALLFVMLFRQCHVDADEIRSMNWKYYSDYPGLWAHCDFIGFGPGSLELRNDTIFRTDTAIARVDFAYKRYTGRSILRLRSLSGDRLVEYVDI